MNLFHVRPQPASTVYPAELFGAFVTAVNFLYAVSLISVLYLEGVAVEVNPASQTPIPTHIHDGIVIILVMLQEHDPSQLLPTEITLTFLLFVVVTGVIRVRGVLVQLVNLHHLWAHASVVTFKPFAVDAVLSVN